MVQLVLSSPKGNQGGKYFPYLGFLGLTPIRVEGIVRTKLDSDLKLLPATSLSISVRCYEHRIGRVNVTNSKLLVDYTQVLWTKSDDVEYEPVGVLEYPFRITLPVNIAGFSTAVFVDYRCTWRVEAVLSHVPITGVGSRQLRHFELPLTRYDLPKHISPPPGPVGTLDQWTNKPRAPRIQYSLEPPIQPVGPSETFSIPLRLQPMDPSVIIKNATVFVERRIHLHDPPLTSSPVPIPTSSKSSPNSHSQPITSPSASPHFATTPLSSSHGSYFSPTNASSPQDRQVHTKSTAPPPAFPRTESKASLSSSNPTITPNTLYPSTASVISYDSAAPLLASSPTAPQVPYNPPQPPHSAIPSPASAKVVVNTIVGTEIESFTRDARGIWSQTLTLEWPTSKSHSRWAIGETISSDFITVKYFIRVKISISSPGGGTETVELGEKELVVVSTSEQERQNAQATYAELVESGRVSDTLRSKSKSPRRLRPDREPEDVPPSPAPYRGATGASSSTSGRAKAPRRPHTSAGPRDKSNFAKNSGGDPHQKRRSEVGWGAMGLPIPMSMKAPGVSNAEDYTPPRPKKGGNEDISKKGRSSSSGKLNSNSFWTVAPPMKNQSSSSGGSSRGLSRSAGDTAQSTSSTSTTASSSSLSSARSVGRRERRAKNGESSTEEERGDEMRRRHNGKRPGTSQSAQASMGTGTVKLDSSSKGPPPSSFNPVITGRLDDGGDQHAVREWEEELARIEEKSRKESDLLGFARLRKRSFVSTMKDLFPSKNKVFNFGDESST